MKFFLVQYHVINLVPGKGHYYLMFRVNQCQRIENKKGGVKIANLPCHLQLLFIVTQHNLMSAKMSGNLFWNLQAEKKSFVNKHKKYFYSDGALVKIDHTIQDFFKLDFYVNSPLCTLLDSSQNIYTNYKQNSKVLKGFENNRVSNLFRP